MTILDKILLKLPSDTKMVVASTYQGMGFILTNKSEIVFRNDNLHHCERKAIAAEINYIIKQT